MGPEEIARLNELARKSKTEGLTEPEQAEQAVLRRAYIDAVKGNLQTHLDNTYVVDRNGVRRKLQRKGGAGT